MGEESQSGGIFANPTLVAIIASAAAGCIALVLLATLACVCCRKRAHQSLPDSARANAVPQAAPQAAVPQRARVATPSATRAPNTQARPARLSRDDKILAMTEMGFEFEVALQALEQHHWDVNGAAMSLS